MTKVVAMCPACNSTNSFHWGKYIATPVCKCNECHTIFFARPISYKNDYFDYHQTLNYDDKQRATAELEIRKSQTATKIRIIQSKIPNQSLRILDVGSGPGCFAAGARQFGHEVLCGDINVAAVEFGKRNYGNQFVDIFEERLGFFDVITFFHVIEHLEFPDALVSRAIELLRPGGLFYAHVPKGETASNTLETGIKRFIRPSYDRAGCLYLPDHFTGFTLKGLKEFGNRMGLSEVEVGALNFYSSEYDPRFLNIRGKYLRSMTKLGIEVVRGSIDAAFGGAWLRLLGRKPILATDNR